MKLALFRYWVNQLRVKAPLDKPVRVRRQHCQPIEGDTVDAECRVGAKYMYIYISPVCKDPVEALIHEWAHLRADPRGHSRRWGAEYARLWKLIVDPT